MEQKRGNGPKKEWMEQKKSGWNKKRVNGTTKKMMAQKTCQCDTFEELVPYHSDLTSKEDNLN